MQIDMCISSVVLRSSPRLIVKDLCCLSVSMMVYFSVYCLMYFFECLSCFWLVWAVGWWMTSLAHFRCFYASYSLACLEWTVIEEILQYGILEMVSMCFLCYSQCGQWKQEFSGVIKLPWFWIFQCHAVIIVASLHQSMFTSIVTFYGNNQFHFAVTQGYPLFLHELSIDYITILHHTKALYNQFPAV